MTRLLAALALLGAACSGSSGDAGRVEPPMTTPASSSSSTSVRSSITGPEAASTCPELPQGERVSEHAGQRRVTLWFAPQLAPEPAPVVVLWHGFGGDARDFATATGLAALGPDQGVVVVAPQGVGQPPQWELLGGPADDLGFADTLLDQIRADPCLDADNVWLVGFSNGSAFAGLVGCRRVDGVRGVVMNAGLPPAVCPDQPELDVIVAHGTADAVVPYGGGDQAVGDEAMTLEGVRASTQEWAERAGCRAPPATTTVAVAVERTNWSSCAAGADVSLYTFEGGGHRWPGRPLVAGSGTVVDTVDLTCVVLDAMGTSGEGCPSP